MGGAIFRNRQNQRASTCCKGLQSCAELTDPSLKQINIKS